MLTIEVRDGDFQITFTEPTVQQIGFISQQAKDRAFKTHLASYRRTSRAIAPPSGMLMPSNAEKTDAQLRSEWESTYVNSSTNPGPESPLRWAYQYEYAKREWEKLATELRRAVGTN